MARPAWHHDGRSRHARGYGAAWDKLRRVILERDGYRCRCAACVAGARLWPATHVDHIISKAEWLRTHGSLAGCDDPTNLRAMARVCHERKSAEERGYIIRGGADASGMPLDPAHPWRKAGGGS